MLIGKWDLRLEKGIVQTASLTEEMERCRTGTFLLPQNKADLPMGITRLAFSLEWGRGDEH